MKTCLKCEVSKEDIDFYADKQRPSGLHPYCKACSDARRRASHIANLERERARKAAYRSAHLEQTRAAYRAWAEANSERVKTTARLRRAKNKETAKQYQATYRQEHLERAKARIAEWKASNPGAVNSQNAARHARKLRATPPWANRAAIDGLYELAAEVSAQTGEAHHVDHIVPLKSRLVCGLHCEANLRVIDALTNLKKNNCHWPDMP